jgi:hypothetical protein
VGESLHFAEVGYILRQTKEKQFALFFVDDRASSEEHKGFQLSAFFQKLACMFEFEFVIVVVRLGAKSDFLDDNFLCLCRNLLLLLLLVVEELFVIKARASRVKMTIGS